MSKVKQPVMSKDVYEPICELLGIDTSKELSRKLVITLELDSFVVIEKTALINKEDK